MYNKLFTKILDSSIWLESTTTRLVWLTFLAAMDEHGFAQFASASNVAHRARVSVEEAEEALKVLEAPDKDSADKDNEGRRLEQVPGGWMVLNSMKYRDLVTKAVIQEQTRLRVKRHRDHKNGVVEPDNAKCNAPVTHSNESVTPSEARARAESEALLSVEEESFNIFWKAYPKKQKRLDALKVWKSLKPSKALRDLMIQVIAAQKTTDSWKEHNGRYIPLPSNWLEKKRWTDEIQVSTTVEKPRPSSADIDRAQGVTS